MLSLLLSLVVIATCYFHGIGSVEAVVASVLYVQPGGSSARFSTRQNAAFWRTSDFTLGFQPMADADEYLLCIWRSADLNQTALWWPSAEDFNRTAVQLQSQRSGSAPAITRSSPTVANGTIFRFNSNGSLQLISEEGGGGMVLWSVGSNASHAELQNTGNLVLRDGRNGTIWQSFGDCRDTMIMREGQGSSSDVDLVASNARLLQSRSSSNQSSSSSYRAGRFYVKTDGQQNLYLHAMEAYYGVDYIYSYGAINVSGYFQVSKGSKRVYKSNASMGISLVKLDVDSNIRVYIWSESTWQAAWQLIRHRCLLASPCGPFAICQEIDVGSFNCSCPPGYAFLDPLDSSKGCLSITNLNFTTICTSASNYYTPDSFSMTPLPNSDYDYGDLGSPSPVSTVEECGLLCLQHCECAAASLVVSSGTCYLKNGNTTGGIVMNGYTTNSNTLLIKQLRPATSTQTSDGRRRELDAIAIAGSVIVAAAAAVVCVVVVVRRIMSRRRRGISAVLLGMDGDIDGGPVVRFTHEQLVEATENFRHLLGEGGFGKVYKGWVKKQKAPSAIAEVGTTTTTTTTTTSGEVVMRAVAVKVLKGPDVQMNGGGPIGEEGRKKEKWAAKQFRAEVSTLGKIHHVNLVSLIGYCDEQMVDGRQMRALVFEFMEGGSMDGFLSRSRSAATAPVIAGTINGGGSGDEEEEEEEEEESEVNLEQQQQQQEEVDWERKYWMAMGIARGIAYLHHECRPPILHSDIKPQNVLLDGQFRAKLADFGFARRFQESKSHLTMSAVQGTRGYMAPEWLKTDEITSKVDVYGFGVVVLELVRGFCGGGGVEKEGGDSNDDDDDDGVQLPAVEWAFRYLRRFEESTSEAKEEDRVQQQKIQVLKVGLWCVQHAPQMRPSMQQVVGLMEKIGRRRQEVEEQEEEEDHIHIQFPPPPRPLHYSHSSPASTLFQPLSALSAR